MARVEGRTHSYVVAIQHASLSSQALYVMFPVSLYCSTEATVAE